MLVLRFPREIAGLFQAYKIAAPVNVSSLSDAIVAFGPEFQNALWYSTYGQRAGGTYEGRSSGYEGQGQADDSNRKNFLDWVRKAAEFVVDATDPATVDPNDPNKDPGKTPPPKKEDEKILGMSVSTFLVVAGLVVIGVLVAIIATKRNG